MLGEEKNCFCNKTRCDNLVSLFFLINKKQAQVDIVSFVKSGHVLQMQIALCSVLSNPFILASIKPTKFPDVVR